MNQSWIASPVLALALISSNLGAETCKTQLPNTATPSPAQWLESAVLEKQDGAWKIVFFQSTRVPAASAAR